MVTKIVSAICLTLAFLNGPLFGGSVGHNISLTELSSTNLEVKYDNSTVGVLVTLNGIGDSWTVTLPASAFILGFGGGTWAEPENPTTMGNAVTAIGNSTLSVMSDVASTSLLANGATISTGAFDQRDSQPITITFTDIQDGAIRVPETGFSFGLFFISLTGLFCASRFRCFRLA